jgi:outer membrane scaffolding protein for murein synthesis (MipA/OmpV family)
MKKLLVGIAALLVSSGAAAGKMPLWELAGGGGVIRIPDYRGAEHARTYPFPVIIPFYRGRYLRSDEEGVRGELFRSDRIRLDFSVDGGVPVDSERNAARAGMPDLDPTLQLGPALNVKLWEASAPSRALVLFLPLRAVFAVSNDGIEDTGATFSPQLSYYRRVPVAGCPWKLGLSGGLEFGSNGFHDYYYNVAPEYASASRPAYDADGGFAGYRFTGTFYCRYRNSWISFFGRYDRVDGAVFEDSPLVGRRDGLTAGLVVTWILGRSKKMVETRDWSIE